MRTLELAVDWSSYAEVYDLMAEANSAYQDLVRDFSDFVASSTFSPGDTLIDLGAGTGNYSLLLARLHPHCRVLCMDRDFEMIRAAERKASALAAENIQFLVADVRDIQMADSSAAFVVAIHSLYAMPNPSQVLQTIFHWLRPGGRLFLCDPGRVINVIDWATFLLRESYRQRGLIRTLRVFWRGRMIAKQNRRIAAAQRRGDYWLHSHEECRQVVEQAGFCILSAKTVYRGCSDLMICLKP